MIYDKADEVIEELFEEFLYRYQIRLETSMLICCTKSQSGWIIYREKTTTTKKILSMMMVNVFNTLQQ